jgi:hypothetical protein
MTSSICSQFLQMLDTYDSFYQTKLEIFDFIHTTSYLCTQHKRIKMVKDNETVIK